MSAARRAGKASRAALSCTPKVHTALESAGALVGLRNSWWLEVLIVFACRSLPYSTVYNQRATVQTLLCTLLRLPASMHTTTCKNVRTISCVRRSCCSEGSYMYSPFHTRGSTRQWSDSVVRRGSRVVASYVTLFCTRIFRYAYVRKDCVCDALCRDARSLRRCPSPPHEYGNDASRTSDAICTGYG